MLMDAPMMQDDTDSESKYVVMCDTQESSEFPHFLAPCPVKDPIKNRSQDNDPGWNTYSWRNESKDVSQPASPDHLIITGEWLRRVITDRCHDGAEKRGFGRLTLTQQWFFMVNEVLIVRLLGAGSYVLRGTFRMKFTIFFFLERQQII